MNDPKIYVGTYAKYNAGDLSGAWLSLRDYATYEELIEACLELHSDEADPELMIQDCEDMPDGLTVGESISREEFDDIKQALQEESAGVPAYSIIDYSDKAIAVTGDTRKIAAELRAETTEAYETIYTALNPSDNRTLVTLGEFLMAVPEAWGPGLCAFIKNFCADMGWSWIEPGRNRAHAI